MTARSLAWRTVAARPARTALAVAGVAVIGALLFTMLLLSRGLLLSFRDLLDAGGYDIRVAATDVFPAPRGSLPHATQLVDDIARLPEVQEVTMVRRERAVAEPKGKPPIRMTFVGVSSSAGRRAWRIKAGDDFSAAALPSGLPPLVISERLAATLGLGPGSTLPVRVLISGLASALPVVTFEVVGVALFGFESGDDFVSATTVESFRKARAQSTADEADMVLVASRPESGVAAAVDAVKRLRPDLRVYSNEQIVARFNQNGFAYFRQISFVLTSITLAFAFLLIATVLSVSVNQRLNEVAALRALGIARRRIAAILLWESIWLVASGGLLSLPVGGLLAMQLDRILRTMPGVPDRLHFFVFEPRALAVHAALLAATALGAAVYPIWVSMRLPIAATLRRETVS
jgi:putative ABC transport system permease protein